jgi:hypothetical protein
LVPLIQKFWANQFTFWDPNGDGSLDVPDWPEYEGKSRQVYRFGHGIGSGVTDFVPELVTDPLIEKETENILEKCEFWQDAPYYNPEAKHRAFRVGGQTRLRKEF